MSFFGFDFSMSGAIRDLEYTLVECRRQVGTGKGNHNESQPIPGYRWVDNYRLTMREMEQKQTNLVGHELSGEMMRKVHDRLVELYREDADDDVTIEGFTRDGGRWQFKLLTDDHDSGWNPRRTVRENSFFF